MANTTAVYARTDTDVKENAESILSGLGNNSVKRNTNAIQSDRAS